MAVQRKKALDYRYNSSVALSELEEYRQQFQQIADEAQELTQGLDEARFNWRPSPTQWSIEECLAHLITVGSNEVIALEEAIRRGKERGLNSAGPFTYGPVERFILSMTEPPVRQPMSAPLRFRPFLLFASITCCRSSATHMSATYP